MNLTAAFQLAEQAHGFQTKNGLPFVYHPLAVASLVLKFGGTEAQAQAALLHDTIVDGRLSIAEIQKEFGLRVAQYVETFQDPDLPSNGGTPWSEAKKAYLRKLASAEVSGLFIVACEELHDGSELLHDLRYKGAEVWKRYPVHGMEVFWYYRELLQLFHSKLIGDQYRALVGEFASLVKSLKAIILEGVAS